MARSSVAKADSAKRSKAVNFRDNEIWETLNSLSDSPGGSARVCLRRYFYLMSKSVPTLDKLFTLAEISLICEALPHSESSGVNLSLPSIMTVWFVVEEAILLRQLDLKWDVDTPSLVEKLKQLTDSQLFSLVFAVEQFWMLRHRNSDNGEDWTQELNQVGFTGRYQKIKAVK